MVGLYHKHKVEREQKRFVHRFLHFLVGFFLLCGILFLLVVLLFNGERIKGPLATYLSEHTGLEVVIGRADFSPLYPHIIKLSDVSFGQSKVNELYLDYDLLSAFSKQLTLRDLYVNGLTLHEPDLQKLIEAQSPYDQVHIDLLRLHHIPLITQLFKSKDSSLRLKQVDYSSKKDITFSNGYLDALQGNFGQDPIKNLAVSFRSTQEGLYLDDVSLGIRGGIVSGKGLFKPNHLFTFSEPESDQFNLLHRIVDNKFTSNLLGTLEMDELHLSKLILDQRLKTQYHINVTAPHVSLAEVILINDNGSGSDILKSVKATTTKAQDKNDKLNSYNFVMQGITGHFKKFALENGQLTGVFTGGIGEISFPELMTTVTQNNCTFNFSPFDVQFSLQGSVYEGSVSIHGTYDRLSNAIAINQLDLENNKLELNDSRLNFLHEMKRSLFTVENAKFKNMEFLSYLNDLPVSIQSISGEAAAWSLIAPTDPQKITKAHSLKDFIVLSKQERPESVFDSTKNSSLKLQLTNMLYSDLRFKSTEAQFDMHDNLLQFKFPKILFKTSEAQVAGSYSLEEGYYKNTFTLNATDFDLDDLNSNLINHLLAGKVNVKVDMWSKSADFFSEMTGSASINSDKMLISDFGLDLINGGKLRNFKLDSTEFMTALRGSAAGISQLKWNIDADRGYLKHNGSMGLSTADTVFTVHMDLQDMSVMGRYYLESLPRDSCTEMTIMGSLKSPEFHINALSRGERRPGLYLPQYEASALAKEQTDTKLKAPYNKPVAQPKPVEPAVEQKDAIPSPATDQKNAPDAVTEATQLEHDDHKHHVPETVSPAAAPAPVADASSTAPAKTDVPQAEPGSLESLLEDHADTAPVETKRTPPVEAETAPVAKAGEKLTDTADTTAPDTTAPNTTAVESEQKSKAEVGKASKLMKPIETTATTAPGETVESATTATTTEQLQTVATAPEATAVESKAPQTTEEAPQTTAPAAEVAEAVAHPAQSEAAASTESKATEAVTEAPTSAPEAVVGNKDTAVTEPVPGETTESSTTTATTTEPKEAVETPKPDTVAQAEQPTHQQTAPTPATSEETPSAEASAKPEVTESQDSSKEEVTPPVEEQTTAPEATAEVSEAASPETVAEPAQQEQDKEQTLVSPEAKPVAESTPETAPVATTEDETVQPAQTTEQNTTPVETTDTVATKTAPTEEEPAPAVENEETKKEASAPVEEQTAEVSGTQESTKSASKLPQAETVTDTQTTPAGESASDKELAEQEAYEAGAAKEAELKAQEEKRALELKKAQEFEQQLLEEAALESFFGISEEEEEIF